MNASSGTVAEASGEGESMAINRRPRRIGSGGVRRRAVLAVPVVAAALVVTAAPAGAATVAGVPECLADLGVF
jgi:hypothetical protein